MSKPEWLIVGEDDDDAAFAPVMCKTTACGFPAAQWGGRGETSCRATVPLGQRHTWRQSWPKSQCGEFRFAPRRFPVPEVRSACAVGPRIRALWEPGDPRSRPSPLAPCPRPWPSSANTHMNGSVDSPENALHLAEAGGLCGESRARTG